MTEHRQSPPGAQWILFLSLGLIWLPPFLLVAPLWEKARYYDYAVIVFPLCAYLLWLGRTHLQPAQTDRIGFVDTVILTLGALAMLLIAWLGVGTYAWRALNGLAAITAIGLSAWLLLRTGGLRRGLALAGIGAFALTAFPWPLPWENPVVDGFTDRVLAFNAFVLPLLGVPVEVAGNQLVVGDYRVAVAEACSGIKSLQMLLAAALFIGEVLRLPWWARGLLALAVWPLAFVFNVLRASALAYGSFVAGDSWYDQWHDTSGYLSFIFSGASLFLLSRLLPGAREPGPAPTEAVFASSGGRWWRLLPLGLLAGATVLLGMHRLPWGPGSTRAVSLAALDLPREWAPSFLVVPEDAETMLFCEDIQRLRLPLGQGREVEVYAMLWDDLIAGYTDVALHRPDACMVQYGGGTLLAGPLVRTLPDGTECQFYRIAYPRQNRTLFVYRMIGRISDQQLVREGWAGDISEGYRYNQKLSLARSARSREERLFMVFVGIDADVSLPVADTMVSTIFASGIEALERTGLITSDGP